MPHLRFVIASAALVLPAIAFGLNALISFRERGLVEPLDIPAAVAFAALALFAWRGSRQALMAGVALAIVYLASVLISASAVLIAYWAATIALIAQALFVRVMKLA